MELNLGVLLELKAKNATNTGSRTIALATTSVIKAHGSLPRSALTVLSPRSKVRTRCRACVSVHQDRAGLGVRSLA